MLDVNLINSWSYIIAIDTVVFFAFVLAALYVFFKRSDSRSLKIASLVYAFSYGTGFFMGDVIDEGGKYLAWNAYYLNWVIFDAFTIFTIFAIHTLTKTLHHKAVKFAFLMTTINMCSYLIMHYLAFEMRYPSHWFYVVYSSLVNVTAILIASGFAFKFRLNWAYRCTSNYP